MSEVRQNPKHAPRSTGIARTKMVQRPGHGQSQFSKSAGVAPAPAKPSAPAPTPSSATKARSTAAESTPVPKSLNADQIDFLKRLVDAWGSRARDAKVQINALPEGEEKAAAIESFDRDYAIAESSWGALELMTPAEAPSATSRSMAE